MITVFSSAQRTATATSVPFTTPRAKGLRLFYDVTTDDGGTLDIKLQCGSPSGDWIDLAGAAFAQISAVGQGHLTIYPGIAETADVSVSDVVTSPWRVVATMGSTPDMVFRVDALEIR